MSHELHSAWQSHVPRIASPHKHWLTDTTSLTKKLKKHCQHFAVQCLNQINTSLSLAESSSLQLPRGRRVIQRQVLLICDGMPAVFAHTVTCLKKANRDWHFLSHLGNQALGTALFSNPLIRRESFEYTRLCARDTMYQAAQAALRQYNFDVPLPPHLWARRCIFTHSLHSGSRMMVTELMLPTVYQLQPQP